MSIFFKVILFAFSIVTPTILLGGKSELLNEFHTSGFVQVKSEDVRPMKGSGSNTSAIYHVHGLFQEDPKTSIVCKVLKGTKNERVNLEALKPFVDSYHHLKKQRGSEFPPTLPLIASYRGFLKGKEDEYVFFIQASGNSVFEIMLEWAKRGYGWCGLNPEESKNKLSYAFQNVGRAVANFHLKYGIYNETEEVFKTVTHGDLHTSNIFYNLWTNETTFIDYETMANARISPRNVLIDIDRLFNFSRSETEKFIAEEAGAEFVKRSNVYFLDEYQSDLKRKYIAAKLQIMDSFFRSLKTGYEEAFLSAGYKIYFDKVQIKKIDTIKTI